MLARDPAGTALGDPEDGDEQVDCSASSFGAQKFPRDSSLSMSMSKACSATSFRLRSQDGGKQVVGFFEFLERHASCGA